MFHKSDQFYNQFMYKGEIAVPQHQLHSLLEAATILKIRGNSILYI